MFVELILEAAKATAKNKFAATKGAMFTSLKRKSY